MGGGGYWGYERHLERQRVDEGKRYVAQRLESARVAMGQGRLQEAETAVAEALVRDVGNAVALDLRKRMDAQRQGARASVSAGRRHLQQSRLVSARRLLAEANAKEHGSKAAATLEIDIARREQLREKALAEGRSCLNSGNLECAVTHAMRALELDRESEAAEQMKREVHSKKEPQTSQDALAQSVSAGEIIPSRDPHAAANSHLPPSGLVESPSVRVGDRWVTEVIDHQDANLNYRSERIAQSVGGGRVVTTVKTLKSNYTRTIEYDDQWGLLLTRLPKGATTTFSPALPYMSFPLSPGKTWQARVTEVSPGSGDKIHMITARVGKWESVTVPAGTFQALRIELNDDISESGVVIQQGLDISWYAPEVRRSVKTEEMSFNPRTGERRRRTITLTEYYLR